MCVQDALQSKDGSGPLSRIEFHLASADVRQQDGDDVDGAEIGEGRQGDHLLGSFAFGLGQVLRHKRQEFGGDEGTVAEIAHHERREALVGLVRRIASGPQQVGHVQQSSLFQLLVRLNGAAFHQILRHLDVPFIFKENIINNITSK